MYQVVFTTTYNQIQLHNHTRERVLKWKTKEMRGLKILSEMDYNHKAELYKNIPGHAIPKTKFNDTTTNGLTMCVMKWLTLKGHYCSRIQSQGQFQPKLGIWTRSTVKRGIGDLISVINGKTVMIEIKVGNDKQSQYQKNTQIEVEQSGGTYLIARDFESFFQWYVNLVGDDPAIQQFSRDKSP